jgi:hypothetical protein
VIELIGHVVVADRLTAERELQRTALGVAVGSDETSGRRSKLALIAFDVRHDQRLRPVIAAEQFGLAWPPVRADRGDTRRGRKLLSKCRASGNRAGIVDRPAASGCRENHQVRLSDVEALF